MCLVAEYFIAKPYRGKEADMIRTRNVNSWQLKEHGVDVGHRGSGFGRRMDHSEKVLENTIDSFNFAFKMVRLL